MSGILRRAGAALLCLFCLLGLAACKPRPGSSARPAGKAASSKQEQSASEPSRVPEEDSSEADEVSQEPAVEIDPQAAAQSMIDDGLVAVISNYNNESFDRTSQINPAQMYWSIYQWFASQPDYTPEKQDYEGYAQLPADKVEQAIERWYGPQAPLIEGKPSVLGEAMSGELINVDEKRSSYYFLQAGEPSGEAFSELKDYRVDKDGIVTFRVATEGADGVHAHTYVIKARRAENGSFYIVSLNRGA